MNMNRSFLNFFIVLGIGDLIYGLWSGDRISVVIGGVIIVVVISIIQKDKETKKNSVAGKKARVKR